MKIKKKTAIVLGFTLGAVLFATSAFADIMSKSGYDQLKDSLKITADKMANEYDSVTLNLDYAVKFDGVVLETQESVEKYDRLRNATQSIHKGKDMKNRETFYHSYADQGIVIQDHPLENTTYITEFPEGRDVHMFSDPFKEEGMDDIEKIVDAVVGNLKEYVLIEEGLDGRRQANATLTEMQIPTVVNALSSFVVKEEMAVGEDKIRLVKDIYVSKVVGSAVIGPDNVLQEGLITIEIKGKDKDGNEHEFSIEILGSLSDINATQVTKPDYSGRTVIKDTYKAGHDFNPEKFIGTYKSDIIIEEDARLIKVGERILNITKIDNKEIHGSLAIEYKEEYAHLKPEDQGFDFVIPFDGDAQKNYGGNQIESEDGSTINMHIHLNDYGYTVDFNADRSTNKHDVQNYTGTGLFIPVLE